MGVLISQVLHNTVLEVVLHPYHNLIQSQWNQTGEDEVIRMGFMQHPCCPWRKEYLHKCRQKMPNDHRDTHYQAKNAVMPA